MKKMVQSIWNKHLSLISGPKHSIGSGILGRVLRTYYYLTCPGRVFVPPLDDLTLIFEEEREDSDQSKEADSLCVYMGCLNLQACFEVAISLSHFFDYSKYVALGYIGIHHPYQ